MKSTLLLFAIVCLLVSSIVGLAPRKIEPTIPRRVIFDPTATFSRNSYFLSSRWKNLEARDALRHPSSAGTQDIFKSNHNNTSGSSSNLRSNDVKSTSLPRPSFLRIPLLASKTTTTSRKKDLKTFPRYLEVECWKRQDLRALEPVLQAFADSCQQITRIVQRAQTDDVYGIAETGENGFGIENIQGEIQQKLDVLCNTIMMRTFCGSSSDTILSVASEEEEVPRCCSDVMV
jgi:hypothetical protein